VLGRREDHRTRLEMIHKKPRGRCDRNTQKSHINAGFRICRARDGPPELGRRSLDLDQFTLVRVSSADGAAHSVVSKGDSRMRPVPSHRSQAAG
jgi:hypothetical protein